MVLVFHQNGRSTVSARLIAPGSRLVGFGPSWSLGYLRAHTQELLTEAGYPTAAASLDPTPLAAALDAVRTHLEKEGDLRAHAIAQGLLVA